MEISKVDPTAGKDDAEKAKLQKELERDKEQFAKEWDTEHKTFNQRKDNYRQNQIRAAALLYDQCSQGMRTKLKSRGDWDDTERDPVKLLAAIKEHSMNYEASECIHKTALDALKNFVNLKQNREESITDYSARFKAAKDVLWSHIGSDFLNLMRAAPNYLDVLKTNDSDKYNELRDKVVETLMTHMFMSNADQNKCGSLMARFRTDHTLASGW